MSTRVVQAMQAMRERSTPADRIAHADEDVREAMALAEQSVRHYAQRFTVTGWSAEDEPEFAVIRRTIVARLRLTRED